MTSVNITSIINCSSQDPKHPASNLLKRSGGSWLCSPADAKLNRAEVSFKLSLSCTISHIDIGNHGSFSVEVQASCDDKPYRTLITQSTFMSVSDSRMGKNLHSVKMFKSDDFDSSIRGFLCDRIKLICFQPYRKDKSFGIAMVKVMTDSLPNENSSPLQVTSGKMEEFMKQHRTTENKSSNRKAWFEGAMEGRLKQIAETGKIASTDRSVRMVMASVKSPSHRTPLVNELLNQKSSPSSNQPTFMGSVRTFFRKLDYSDIDPYTMKVSELRHQFEKMKARKLSSDEKKLFKGYTLEFFASRVGENSRESQNHAEGRVPVKRTPPVDKKTEKLAKELMAKLTPITPQLPARHHSTDQVKECPPVIVLDEDDEFSPHCIGSPGSPSEDFTDLTSLTSPHVVQSPSTHLVQSPSTHLVQSPSTHLVQSPSTHLVQSPSTHLVQSPYTKPVQSTKPIQSTSTPSVRSIQPVQSTCTTPMQSTQPIQSTKPVQSTSTPSVQSTCTKPVQSPLICNNKVPEVTANTVNHLNTSSKAPQPGFFIFPQALSQPPALVSPFQTNSVSPATLQISSNSAQQPSAVHTITKQSVEQALNNVKQFMVVNTSHSSPSLTNLSPTTAAVASSRSLLSGHKGSAFSPITSTPQSRKSLATPKSFANEHAPTTFSTPLNMSTLWALNSTSQPKKQQQSPSASTAREKPILTPPLRTPVRRIVPKLKPSPSAPVLHLKPPRSATATPKSKASQSMPSTPKSSQSALSTPKSSQSALSTPKSHPILSKRSTAVSPMVLNSHLPRSEILPAATKRTIAELLSDDDDDLMLPVSKKPTNEMANVSVRSMTSSSQLTLQDLISSDEEDANITAGSNHSNAVNVSVTKAANTSITNVTNTSVLNPVSSITSKSVESKVDVILSSDSEEDLPDIALASDDESIPDVFSQYQRPEQSDAGIDAVQCPICQAYFPQPLIEAHASDCIIE